MGTMEPIKLREYMKKHTGGNKEGFGFTLVELLVVSAILALLIAVLVPALALAKERARRVVCAKNINQFILGIMVYADVHDQKLPSGRSEAGGDGEDEHTPVISRKVGDVLVEILGGHAVLKCPWLSEPFDDDQGWYYEDYGYVLGYHYLGGHRETPWPVSSYPMRFPIPPELLNWQAWKSPQASADNGRMEVVVDLNAFSWDGRTFAPHGKRGPINKYHEPFTGGMAPQQAGSVGGNVGRMDGSVSWKKSEDMKARQCSRFEGCYGFW